MKRCFVICPIGDEGTVTRQNADKVLKHIISPVIKDFGYEEPSRADLTANHQQTIPEDISQRLFESDLVIADLTGCNPNVFYELGKRHAWGGRCIHLTQDKSTLPFDVKQYRVIEYNITDLDLVESVRRDLNAAIDNVEKSARMRPIPLSTDDVIQMTGATVLVERKDGRRNHYELAQRVANSPCSRVFLMQRSSSFILGPEQGWGEEKDFYNIMLKKIKEGTDFFHIVSLEGLEWHLDRQDSVFPEAVEALNRLLKKGNTIGIKGKNKNFYFKKLPDQKVEKDMKPDRQARTLLVEYPSGEAEGILVVDLGGRQSAFHLRGPAMKTFMETCMEFYHECDHLKWIDLDPVSAKLKARGELPHND